MSKKHDKKIADIVTKPLSEKIKENLEKSDLEIKNLKKSNDEVAEILDDVVTYATLSDESAKETFLNDFKEKRERMKNAPKDPAKFKISTIYDKKRDEELADNLRKSLANYSHSTNISSYKTYKKEINAVPDYKIFIGNPDNIVGTNVFSEYGCKIQRNDTSIIATYDEDSNEVKNNKEDFIKYYTTLTEKITKDKTELRKIALENEKELELIKNKKKVDEKRDTDTPAPFADKILNKVDELANKALDYADDHLPLPLQIATGAAGLASLITAGVVSISVGIAEFPSRMIIEELQDSNFDNKFIAEAQRHILLIKLCEFIANEQCEKTN